MPHLPDDAVWINLSGQDPDLRLEKRVVLFDIWDYTCINCLRTLPYLREWYARYQHLDFTMIGIHTPEFPFGKEPVNLERAVRRLGIRWPIVLDNDQTIWTSFANRYWPTKYLADRSGYLRYRHAGEGQYQAFESALQDLLREDSGGTDLPEIMDIVREDDRPSAVCLPTTPELQADSLGNPQEENQPGSKHRYTLPEDYEEGRFYLQGTWESIPHGHRLVSEHGLIMLSYKAARCNAVLSAQLEASGADHVAESIPIDLTLDGQPLPAEAYGPDVLQHQDQSILRVDAPRMYALSQHEAVETHSLSLAIKEPGFVFYAFSFESCASGQKSPQSNAED